MELDIHLIARAHGLCTVASGQRIKGLIIRYEEAVRRVGEGKPYNNTFELWLRDSVDIAIQRQDVVRTTSALKHYSAELVARSTEIDAKIDRWKRSRPPE
jgi:hypothetical protein